MHVVLKYECWILFAGYDGNIAGGSCIVVNRVGAEGVGFDYGVALIGQIYVSLLCSSLNERDFRVYSRLNLALLILFSIYLLIFGSRCV